jgi:hypothetical protein
MDYVFKDEDLTMPVDITVNGNFVYPDDNKYTYKIRSMDGTILFSSEEQEVVPEEPEDSVEPIEPVSENSQDTETGEIIPTDRIIIVIPKEYNTLEEGKLFKSQIVEVSFLYQKKPYTIKKAYRITSFFYFSASPQDVRNYYGLNNGELPDEDIDLNEIYLQLVQKHGNTFIDCLKSDGVGNIRANRLITLKGVVQVFPSVRLRVNQEENDGSSKFTRYLNKIDWDSFLDDVQAEIEELENNLTGEETITYTSYTPFVVGAVTDAITGES